MPIDPLDQKLAGLERAKATPTDSDPLDAKLAAASEVDPLDAKLGVDHSNLPKSFADLETDPTFQTTMRTFFKERDGKDYSDPKELRQAFENDRTWKQANTASQIKELAQTIGALTYDKMTPEQRKRLRYGKDVWEHLPNVYEPGGRGMSGVWSNLWRGATDPVNAVSAVAGALTGGTGGVATRVGTTALVDGLVSGATNLAEQKVDNEIQRRDGYSLQEAGIAAGAGSAASLAGNVLASRIGSKVAKAEPASGVASETAAKTTANNLDEVVAPRTDVPEYSGFFNIKKITGPDEFRNLVKELAETEGNIRTEQPPTNFGPVRTRTWNEVEDAAVSELKNKLTWADESLMKRQFGTAFNAEEIRMATRVWEENVKHLYSVANAARGGSDAAKAEFIEQLNRVGIITDQLAGISTEAGRALNILRKPKTGDLGGIKDVLNQYGGGAKVEDLAGKVLLLDDPSQASKFAADLTKNTWGDKFWEVWYNSLLSGLSTQTVNTVSNISTQLSSIPETLAAATVGKVRTAKDALLGRATNPADRVYYAEAVGRVKGMLAGAVDGSKAAVKAFVDEETTQGAKEGVESFKAIPSIKLREGAEKATVNVLGKDVPIPFTGEIELGGKQVRLPSRFMAASDEFFKSVGRRAEIYQQAYRALEKAKLSGDVVDEKKFIVDFVENPPKEVLKTADHTAAYYTFTNRPGPTVQAFQKFVQSHPALRLVVPFVRTPANIFNFTFERSIFAPFMGSYRKALEKGGAEADAAVGRMLFGSSLMAATSYAASQGMITGSAPRDAAERDRMKQAKIAENSVRVGDKWVSYSRAAEPFSTIMGIAADLVKASDLLSKDDVEGLGSLVLGAISTNLIDKTFVQGASRAVLAFTDPQRYGENFLQGIAGSMVPSIVAQNANASDPYSRDVRSIMDVLINRTGIGREGLPLRRGLDGEPVYREKPLGTGMERFDRLVSTLYVDTADASKLDKEIYRLGVGQRPSKKIFSDVELSPEQYDKLQLFRGKLAFDRLKPIVEHPNWDSKVPDSIKQKVLQEEFRKATADASAYLLAFYPQLATRKVLNSIEAMQAEIPDPMAPRPLLEQMRSIFGMEE